MSDERQENIPQEGEFNYPPIQEPEPKETKAPETGVYNQGIPTYPGKPKNKKKRVIIIVAACVAVLYLAVAVAAVGGAWRIFSNIRVSYNHDTGRLEIVQGLPAQNEKGVESHLQIQETPFTPEPDANPDGTLSLKQIAKKVRPSVVGVVAQGGSNFAESTSVGSGIILSEDGYIITNNHVIEDQGSVKVKTDDGKEYAARVVGTDSRTDLAVLKVEAKGLPAATFGDSDKLEQGDLAVAIGNPAGLQLQNTVTSGVISAINRNVVVDGQPMTLIQTDASINPGNSGGPLVNAYGQVVGINTVKIGISYYEGLGFAIPMNSVKPIVDELISRGYVAGRPSIGITGGMLSEQQAKMYDVPVGMYVEYVYPGSDAQKKGFMRGDIIIEADGKKITENGDIQAIRDKHKAGDTIKLKIFRNNEQKELSIVLMDEARLNATENSQQS